MPRPFLTMYELLARRDAVNEQLAAFEGVERENALNTIRALMKQHGLTLQQVERHTNKRRTK